jgi:nucleotide-binding universal stress UspA family protein
MSTVELARPVVACVDGSPSALRATRWAAAEAARRGLPLRIVHVVSWPLSAYAKEIAVNAELRTSLTTRSRTILAEARVAAEEAAPGVRASTTSIPGTVAPTLVDWSRGAELIVLGTRGLGGFGALVAGSVAISLAAHAWCPVAVVRGKGDDAAGPIVVGVDASPAAASAIAFAFEEAAVRDAPLVAAHGWQQPAWETLYEASYTRDHVEALEAEAGSWWTSGSRRGSRSTPASRCAAWCGAAARPRCWSTSPPRPSWSWSAAAGTARSAAWPSVRPASNCFATPAARSSWCTPTETRHEPATDQRRTT